MNQYNKPLNETSKTTMLQNLPGLAYRCLNDKDYTMKYVSEGSLELTGYTPDDFIDNRVISFYSIIVRTYRTFLVEEWNEVIKKGGVMDAEYEIIAKDGKTKWVHERGVPVFNEQGELEALEGIIIDVNRVKLLEKQITYLTNFSYKLQLPNREFLIKKMNERSELNTKRGTLFLLNFKDGQKLYRTHGYEYVELFTKSLISKLRTLESKGRVLYHTEEDIYIFYSKYRYSEKEVAEFYANIVSAISRTMIREQIRCRVGVNIITADSGSPENCIIKARLASEAMIDPAKLISLNIYNKEMDAEIKRFDDLKQELMDLTYDIGFGPLRLVFQPIINLQTGALHSFEALARYISPKYGNVSPLEFIPLVEKNRMSIPFGKKIIDLALIFLRKLIGQGMTSFSVSVNISVHQLLDVDFVDDLLKRMERAGVPTNLLTIEVTETIFSTNYDQLNSAILKLRQAGIMTAIDDFGTGYSSLSRIENMDFDVIKVDRVFISPLNDTTIQRSTVPEIISICRKFGFKSLAEGIETEEQYRLLKDNGCLYGQGYYMSKPLETDDALSYGKKHSI